MLTGLAVPCTGPQMKIFGSFLRLVSKIDPCRTRDSAIACGSRVIHGRRSFELPSSSNRMSTNMGRWGNTRFLRFLRFMFNFFSCLFFPFCIGRMEAVLIDRNSTPFGWYVTCKKTLMDLDTTFYHTNCNASGYFSLLFSFNKLHFSLKCFAKVPFISTDIPCSLKLIPKIPLLPWNPSSCLVRRTKTVYWSAH